MSVTRIRNNNMGTCSFDGKFKGMRQPVEFIIYPIQAGDSAEFLLIQSDTRIGRIGLTTGTVTLSPPRAGGSYGRHLVLAKLAGTLSAEELFTLKTHIAASASPHAGSNGIVFTDNSGAVNALAL